MQKIIILTWVSQSPMGGGGAASWDKFSTFLEKTEMEKGGSKNKEYKSNLNRNSDCI